MNYGPYCRSNPHNSVSRPVKLDTDKYMEPTEATAPVVKNFKWLTTAVELTPERYEQVEYNVVGNDAFDKNIFEPTFLKKFRLEWKSNCHESIETRCHFEPNSCGQDLSSQETQYLKDGIWF